MQLVIKVDLDKAGQSLPDIFRLIGSQHGADEPIEDIRAGVAGLIKDKKSNAIGEWEVEEQAEGEDRPHPLERSYRAAATARYARTGQVEVDRFATVSMAGHGAYVQGWLFVPQSEVLTSESEHTPPAKPPQSVIPMRRAGNKVG